MEYFMYKNMETNGNNNKNGQVEGYIHTYQYENGQMKRIENEEPMSTSLLMLVFIIYLVLGIYAAKLSWYSNTKAGWSNGYKVLFAIVAFMFPITYISAHIIFKMDLLARIKDKSPSKSRSYF